LNAIAENEQASADPELRRLLHHILLANRFWLALFVGDGFDMEHESNAPESVQAIAALYRETHGREIAWINGLHDSDLDRVVATRFIPGGSFSVAQAIMQVCLHSHGHRAQCAARLRALGGNPPPTDFISWLKERPGPELG
jgi:uncharacterized damage-inducible protein DinB